MVAHSCFSPDNNIYRTVSVQCTAVYLVLACPSTVCPTLHSFMPAQVAEKNVTNFGEITIFPNMNSDFLPVHTCVLEVVVKLHRVLNPCQV